MTFFIRRVRTRLFFECALEVGSEKSLAPADQCCMYLGLVLAHFVRARPLPGRPRSEHVLFSHRRSARNGGWRWEPPQQPAR